MKKIVLLFVAACIAITSCQKEIADSTKPDHSSGAKLTMLLNASQKDMTKTTLVGTSTVKWTSVDQVTVMYKKNGGSSWVTSLSETASSTTDYETATFTTDLDDPNYGELAYAIYPSNSLAQNVDDKAKITIAATQHPTGTGFDGRSDIMISSSFTPAASVSTQFARVGAILKISINNATLAGEKLLSLSVTGDNALAGNVLVGLSDHAVKGIDPEGSSTTVTAEYAPDDQFELGSGSDYVYLVVMPQTLANGSHLIINGETENHTFTKDVTLKEDIHLNAGHIIPLRFTVSSGVSLRDKVFFEERFTAANGTSGWSGSVASATFVSDNDGWTAANKYAGASCARFGSSSANGNATTPSIVIPADYWGQTIHFSFKAGAWSGDATALGISVDGATISSASETLNDASWKTHSLTLTDVTKSPIAITFTKANRWFLDDVLVYYGEAPAETSLLVSPLEDVNVSYKSGSKEYAVTYTVEGEARTDWAVSTSSPGFSVEKKGDNSGFTVSYVQNTGASRVGSIIVSGNGKSVVVRINQAAKGWVDVLTAEDIGQSSYGDWSGLELTTGAIYAGNSTKNGSNDIQLRSTSLSGIVSTSSGGLVSKVSVVWGTGNDTNGRTLEVYGKNTAYASAADLYGEGTRGTLIGSVNSKDGSTEVSFDSDYKYVGVKSSSGALYLASLTVTWKDIKPDSGIAWKNAGGEVATSGDGTICFNPLSTTGVPVFYNPKGVSTASISFTSNNEGVATVSESGVVSIIGAGEATIQASFSGDATYRASSVAYVLTVSDVTLRDINKAYVGSPAHGSFVTKVEDVLVTQAKAGDLVTILHTPDSNYALGVAVAEDEDTKEVTITDNTFIMPAKEVTVTATYVPTYSVSASSSGHGSVSVTPSGRVKAGTHMTVSVVPDDGFTLNTLTMNGDDILEAMQFDMPATDVTVAATFISQLSAPASVTISSLSSSGFSATWPSVPNAVGYSWTLSSSDTWAGVAAGNTVATASFNVNDLDGTGASNSEGTWTLTHSKTIGDGTYYLYVTANGDNVSYGASNPTRSSAETLLSGPVVGDVLFSCDFGTSAIALAEYTGGTSFNNASSITYTASNTSRVLINTASAGNMTSGNLYFNGNGGSAGYTASIAGIKTYKATKVTVTWAANNAKSDLSILESSTATVTSSGSASNRAVFDLSGSEETITIVFSNNAASNTRIDNVTVLFGQVNN